MKNIGVIDLVIIVLYLAGSVGAGVWVGLRKRKGGEAGSYFLAGNTLAWPSIGLALFATNISCLHLVSLAQARRVRGTSATTSADARVATRTRGR